MECVISSAEWKLKSRNKRLSEYVTFSLEAFTVLMYYNAFPVWNQRWTVDTVSTDGTTSTTVEASDDDDISTLSGLMPKKGFVFMGKSKGARKYEGMVFYNDLRAVVENKGAIADALLNPIS